MFIFIATPIKYICNASTNESGIDGSLLFLRWKTSSFGISIINLLGFDGFKTKPAFNEIEDYLIYKKSER